jgi:hypothetical protein
VDKNTEGLRLFEPHGLEFRKFLGEADRLMPGTAELLRGLFNPETLGIGAMIVGLQMILEHVKAVKEAARESAKAMEEMFKSSRDAALDANEANAEYLRTLDEQKSKMDEIREGEADRLDIIKLQTKEQERILAAKEEIELAGAHGNKTEEDAIKKRYEGLRHGAEAGGEQAENNERRRDFLARQRKAPELKSAAETASAKELQAANAENDPLYGGKALQAALDKKIAEINAKQDKLRFEGNFGAATDLEVTKQKEIAERQQQMLAQHEATEAAKENAENAKRAYQENQRGIDSLTAAFNKAKEEIGIKAGTDQQIKFMQPGAAENTMHGALMAAMDIQKQKGKSSEKDKELLQAFRELMEVTGLNSDGMMGALSKAANKQAVLAQELALVQTRLDALSH